MDYIIAKQHGQDTVLEGVKHFDLAQTLNNGQAFRWEECENGAGFSGIAHGRRLELSFADDTLTLKDCPLGEFEAIWKDYLDLGRDYSGLRKHLSVAGGESLEKALNFSPGLRMMRQDVWEVLISFILSQNSNIPRIKKMISSLCENFGQKLPCGGFDFPKPQDLAKLTVDNLQPIRTGYRADYIIDAAQRVSDGRFDIAALASQPSDEVHQALLQIHGIGPKVAECVLLFGFGRIERFPLDVWIKRVMAALYPEGFPVEVQEYSGIAQQFLFHYARMSKLV